MATPTHRKTAPTWCRIQTPMGVATYQGIKIADKLPSVEALQERIKLLEAQLEKVEGLKKGKEEIINSDYIK